MRNGLAADAGATAPYQGGGIYNQGALTLDDCTVSENVARRRDGLDFGDPGVDGFGGGIYNAGTLTLNECTVNENSAQGGAGFVIEDINGDLSGNGGGGGDG